MNRSRIAVHGAAALIGALSATTSAQNGTWSQVTTIPQASFGASAAVLDGILYVAGGQYANHELNTFLAYDPATDAWSVKPEMPGARYFGDGLVELDGKLYFVGGWTTSPGLPQNNLWRYDPATGVWTASLNDRPGRTGSGAAAAIDGKLYVATAADGSGGYRNFLDSYDPVANSWTAKSSSNNAHGGPAFGAIHGKFYVVGGFDASGQRGNSVEEYDPVADHWTLKTPIPVPGLSDAASAVVNGKLFVAGGSNAGADTAAVYVFDPVLNTWSTAYPPLPAALHGAAGAAVCGRMYVVGGLQPGPNVLASVVAFGLPCYANCDGSTTSPVLNVLDFACFINKFAAGCPQ